MLQDLTTPLSAAQARHLLRRACLNADPDRVAAMVGRTAREVVQEWLAEPLTTKLLPEPYWLTRLYPPTTSTDDEVAAFRNDNQYYIQEVRELWLEDLLSGTLRARMTLFWHNHFVTDVRKYNYGALAHAYIIRLTFGALGDFKALTRGFVTDGSMLYYLDGRYNRRGAPNENFARELLELFTMGPEDADGNPNYTQDDIFEAARAVAGWYMDVRTSWESSQASFYVDTDVKTIFGKTGNHDHDDLIDLIFSERGEQVAAFLARKLLKEFVYAEPTREAVDALATSLLAHNFVMGPVLADLLSSELFFDPTTCGARIKSPVEYVLLDMSAFKGKPPPDREDRLSALASAFSSLGQTLLSPPNVAGWPGHHSWLSTETMPARWNMVDSFMNSAATGINYFDASRRYVEPGASHPAVSLALNLAEALFAIPLEMVEIPHIDRPFEGNLTQFPLPEDLLNGPEWRIDLVKIFLGTTPWYEWDPLSPNAWIMVRNFVVTLSKYPEYQLS